MALRIGPGAPVGQSTPMQQPEVQLPDSGEPNVDDQGGVPDDDSDDQGDDSNKISPENAGYQGPDQGPFICANCQFFDNGHCEVVAGPVDHLGCCNNFSSMSGQQGGPAPEDQEGGNTTGDQSNGAQSATEEPTEAQSSSENA